MEADCSEAPSAREPERRPSVRSERAALVRLRHPGGRPVAATAAAVPAGVGDRPAVVRHQRRHRIPGWSLWLERAALSGLVPDRRLRGRRLPRPGHGLAARNTRFGYFVAFSVFAGGLFSILAALARAREGDSGLGRDGAAVVFASLAAVALADRPHARPAPPWRRWRPRILVAASAVVAVLTLTCRSMRRATPWTPTGVPTGEAFPADLRVLTPPFNIAGAFALVFGAIYSAYIFMPKTRVMRVRGRSAGDRRHRAGDRGGRQFLRLDPGCLARLPRRHAQLARARHAPHRDGRLHPGLDQRPQPLRGDLVLLPGRVPGVLLHLPGVPGQHRGLQRLPAAVHAHRAARAATRRRPGTRPATGPSFVDLGALRQ